MRPFLLQGKRIEQSSSAALDNSSAPTILTLKSNQSLLFAFQAAPGCHCLKITVLPPLSCLINKSDVQFRNFAINLLKYCWRMLIVMPVAIKAHLHNLCVKNNYEARLQTRSTNRSQLRMRGPQKHLIHCPPQKRERKIRDTFLLFAPSNSICFAKPYS